MEAPGKRRNSFLENIGYDPVMIQMRGRVLYADLTEIFP